MQKQFPAIIAALLLLNIISCRTLHSEQQYYLEHFNNLVRKYGWQQGKLTAHTLPANYKLPTRKQTKSFLAFEEHNMAMWPDSMNATYEQIVKAALIANGKIKSDSNTHAIDSFYTNPAKIQYIRKHHLEGPHIHFGFKD